MTDFKLDETTWDLAIENNNFVLIMTTEEISQILGQRLKTFYGEVFIDGTLGVRYFQDILKKNPQPAIIRAVLIDEILDCPGILRIDKLDIDFDEATRELNVTGEALATTGDIIPFSETIGGA